MPLRNGTPTLSIRQPSLSTTQYTVSNAPFRFTRVAQVQSILRLIARLVAASVCAFVFTFELNACTSCMWNVQRITPNDPAFLRRSLNTCTSVFEEATGLGLRGWPVVFVSAVLLWLLSRRKYTEESLLLIRGLGIQTSTSSSSYLSTPRTRFIPTSQIQDIFIHEAFMGFEVKFYLAVIVEGEEEAVVVFPKLMPRRDILEEVWRGAKTVLYQPAKVY